MDEENVVEAAARLHCARLLDTALAKRFPEADVLGLVIIAFTLGAAWGVGEPELIELANAQMDSARVSRSGSLV
jgi:hypothetical protein